MEFCHGYTTKMTHILMKHDDVEEETIQRGKYILSICIALGQVMILLEFTLYIIMLRSLKEKDKSLVNIVQDDILKVTLHVMQSFYSYRSALIFCRQGLGKM